MTVDTLVKNLFWCDIVFISRVDLPEQFMGPAHSQRPVCSHNVRHNKIDDSSVYTNVNSFAIKFGIAGMRVLQCPTLVTNPL